MRKVIGLSLSVALGLTALAAVPVAAGDDVNCNDRTITADVDGKVIHRRGTCRIGAGVHVDGDIESGRDATLLILKPDSSVDGNLKIKATDAEVKLLPGSEVDGHVEVGTGRTWLNLQGTTINGNLITESGGGTVGMSDSIAVVHLVAASTIGGNIELKGFGDAIDWGDDNAFGATTVDGNIKCDGFGVAFGYVPGFVGGNIDC